MTATAGAEPFELFAIRHARRSGRKGGDSIIGGDLHAEGPGIASSPQLEDIVRRDGAPRPL